MNGIEVREQEGMGAAVAALLAVGVAIMAICGLAACCAGCATTGWVPDWPNWATNAIPSIPGATSQAEDRIPAYTGEQPVAVDHGAPYTVTYGGESWQQWPDGYFDSGFEGWFDKAARRGMGKRLHNAGGRSCENQRVLRIDCRVLSTFADDTGRQVPDKIGFVWAVSGGFVVEFEYTHRGDTLVRGQYTITDTVTGPKVTGNGQRAGSEPSRVKWDVDGKLYAESIRWNYIANHDEADIVPGPWEATQ